MGIIEVEMQVRDEWILGWVSKKIEAGKGQARIKHNEIAEAWKCHRNTARNIVDRLAAVGHIEIDRSHHPDGCLYRLPEKQQKAS